ncbi:MAG: DUF3108 domain-containing protein [Candidatus Marinimicrobia bacterium]|nr:DUF3108 domain-containing protein [Candidatus Neomarinimicrobiota bacterium]
MKNFFLLGFCLVFFSRLNATCGFSVGEKFDYSVKLNFVKAGVSYIKILDVENIRGHEVYHIISETKTTGLWDRMFHIREHMESWTDCDSLFSRKYFKDVDEVNYEKTFEAEFLYQDSIAILRNKKIVPVTGPVMDWLSMIYYIRTVELYEGQEIEMTFFDNNKFKDYSAYVVGQEKVDVMGGTFDCWVVKPTERVEKSMKTKNEIILYLSINQPRIPVKIVSKGKIGTMILEIE